MIDMLLLGVRSSEDLYNASYIRIPTFFVLQVMNENRHRIVAAASNKSKVTVVPCYFLYCILAFGVIGLVAGLPAGRYGVRIRAGATYFSLLQNVQTGCGVHPDAYSLGTGDSFLGRKAAGV
jgi:hypothetical protein